MPNKTITIHPAVEVPEGDWCGKTRETKNRCQRIKAGLLYRCSAFQYLFISGHNSLEEHVKKGGVWLKKHQLCQDACAEAEKKGVNKYNQLVNDLVEGKIGLNLLGSALEESVKRRKDIPIPVKNLLATEGAQPGLITKVIHLLSNIMGVVELAYRRGDSNLPLHVDKVTKTNIENKPICHTCGGSGELLGTGLFGTKYDKPCDCQTKGEKDDNY